MHFGKLLILKWFGYDLKPVTFSSILNSLQCKSHLIGLFPYSCSKVSFHLSPKKIIT